MGYLTKMNGKYGQNGFSAVGFSILGQAPRCVYPLFLSVWPCKTIYRKMLWFLIHNHPSMDHAIQKITDCYSVK